MRQIELTDAVLNHLCYRQEVLLSDGITAFELVYSILHTSSSHEASKLLGTTRKVFDSICQTYLPCSGSAGLLAMAGLQCCSVCLTIRTLSEFYVTTCKICADNRFNKAIPIWANSGTMAKIYKNTPEHHHVEHVIPLFGDDLVCGLHVEENLYYKKFKEYNNG
jgi:hypothetical protein|tara:strand:+ start:4271 stop:4762 length:492 start_codon:yes stop_codon:yes gene_type:complete